MRDGLYAPDTEIYHSKIGNYKIDSGPARAASSDWAKSSGAGVQRGEDGMGAHGMAARSKAKSGRAKTLFLLTGPLYDFSLRT